MLATTVCGEGVAPLCRFVLDRTGDEGLAGLAAVALERPLRVLLYVLVGVVVHRSGVALVNRFTRRYEQEVSHRLDRRQRLGLAGSEGRAETRRFQRLYAIAQAVRSGLGIVVALTVLLLCAALFVDLAPVLAGAGLIGLVVGFGAQNLIADVIAGVAMLVEDQYGVGDWIDVDGTVGEVERVGLRTTSFRDIDGTVWHLGNSKVTQVGNLTQRWARATLDVPLALDTDLAHARRVVQEVADGLAADPDWADDIINRPAIWGMSRWGPDGMALLLVVPTRPLRNWDVIRQLRERLKERFELEGIRMPAPMLEVGGQTTAGRPVTVATRPLARDHPAGRTGRTHGPDADTTGRIPTEYAPVEPEQDHGPGPGA